MTIFSDSFEEAMRNAGLNPPAVITSGKFHRFPGVGKGEKNQAGWCLLFLGGDGGVFGDFSSGLSESWHQEKKRKMTEAEKEAFQKMVEKARKEAEEIKIAEQTTAAKKAKKIWDNSKSADQNHPYLAKKGIAPNGLSQTEGGSLVVPVQNPEGEIVSLQFIANDGSKKFLPRGRIAGCFYLVDNEKSTDEVICIAEGLATAASIHEATGHPVAVAFNAGNLIPVAEVIKKKFSDSKIILCADDDAKTVGNPGITNATVAAIAINGWKAIPDFGTERPDGLSDFNDLHCHLGLDAVKKCIENAKSCDELETDNCNESRSEDDNAVIQKLAALSLMEYDRVRGLEAKKLRVRPATLDRTVEAARRGNDLANGAIFDEVIPWDGPINPEQLLTDISATIRHFIICSQETANTVALWVAMSWFVDVIHTAPLAIITAPEKRCGKTILLTFIGKLSFRPITASSISPAALFRAIEAWQPTLLIDEVDVCLKDNEELRGIINSGHTRDSAFVVRTVGESFIPTKFSTWGPKALSGIGRVADTLLDRAIIFELRRKLPSESVERLRHAEPKLFIALKSKLCRFAEDFREEVRLARPEIPAELNDRAQDNWEPLLAIADIAGGEWPERARKAALKLSGGSVVDETVGVELLADIEEVFQKKNVDRIGTADLIAALVEDEEKPWAGYNRGNPIKPRQLAKRLREYGISSNTIRIGSGTFKGYALDQFNDAFARYLADRSIEK